MVLHKLARQHGSERGLTITVMSLVVTVLAVAVVSAVGIGFWSFREQPADQAAKARAQAALRMQQTVYDGQQRYAGADELAQVDPKVDYTDDAIVAGKVYVKAEGQVVTLASRSNSGRCYWVRGDGASTMFAVADCDVPVEQLNFAAEWAD